MINETDLRSLWGELDSYSKELDEEDSTLKEIWLKMSEIQAKNDKDTTSFASQSEFTFLDPDTPIGLNIGGQIFESDVATLTKDPYSILAALCRRDAPIIEPTRQGIFYLNRDWWLFRHILTFMRTNKLPNELETLKELYMEASFYRLESLQRAIEQIPISSLSNLTPQIAVTWPGLIDSPEPNPLRRPKDSFVLDGTLFKTLNQESKR